MPSNNTQPFCNSAVPSVVDQNDEYFAKPSSSETASICSSSYCTPSVTPFTNGLSSSLMTYGTLPTHVQMENSNIATNSGNPPFFYTPGFDHEQAYATDEQYAQFQDGQPIYNNYISMFTLYLFYISIDVCTKCIK